MKRHSAVVLNLRNPREKVWGILLVIDSAGATVKGIDLNSFEDWTRSVAKGDEAMGLSTVFFPMHRIERIHLDERVGNIKAYVEIFEYRVGHDPWTHLQIPEPDDNVRDL